MPTMRGNTVAAAVLLWCVVASIVPQKADAQGDTTVSIRFGAFVDAYYAYDFGRPPQIDRALTTQAARHSEFNLNLGFLEARLAGPRVRGRLAAQLGTSVQANYAGEPTVGALSGPALSRHVQEAIVGYRMAPNLWVDGGVFFAPFGSESWISSDNWTYTRSLIADFSPYYQAGVRATWQPSPSLTAQLHLVNGWQNISETNSDKAAAVRLDYALTPRLSVAYDAFVGNEQPDTSRFALRVFQEVAARLRVSDRLDISATLDYGTQQQADASPSGAWRGWSVIGRLQLTTMTRIGIRAERYSDEQQIIVLTGRPAGLRVSGGSMNLDVTPSSDLLYRIELRGLRSTDPAFPDRGSVSGLSRTNWVVVTSAALRIL